MKLTQTHRRQQRLLVKLVPVPYHEKLPVELWPCFVVDVHFVQLCKMEIFINYTIFSMIWLKHLLGRLTQISFFVCLNKIAKVSVNNRMIIFINLITALICYRIDDIVQEEFYYTFVWRLMRSITKKSNTFITLLRVNFYFQTLTPPRIFAAQRKLRAGSLKQQKVIKVNT